MQGNLYIVGVGPGDPDLLTIKALKILEKCPVWLAPKAHKDGESTALSIVSAHIATDDKKVVSHRFPMKPVHREKQADETLLKAWQEAAQVVLEQLSAGLDVAFPTLGDPAIYSTGFYLCEALAETGFRDEIEVIPGVSSIGTTAASAVTPLCLGDERLLVLPATFENGEVASLLKIVDVIVFMKVYRVLEKMIEILERENLIDNATLVERAGCSDERVWTNIREAVPENLHYFSTLIVRRKSGGCPRIERQST